MNEKVVLSALFHDVGKLIQRTQLQDGRPHYISGHDFISKFTQDEDILNSIKLHHKAQISHSQVSQNSIAYLIYISDNISAGTDRRMKETLTDNSFNMKLPLSSVFNILNNREANRTHALTDIEKINIPKENNEITSTDYNKLFIKFQDGMRGISFSADYVNSVLELMEATFSYVPSSTHSGQVADISLYDHSKTTAAIASCIYEYLNSQNINNYRNTLFDNEEDFYNEKAFLMFSFDISGIQRFIYTISSKYALKMLRARSFYLEILTEHIIDRLLERCRLSRANLIYSGGGHCYILLPNTAKIKEEIRCFSKTINKWLLGKFGDSLFIATGMAECSANDIMNCKSDKDFSSYKDIFIRLNNSMSENKLKRYGASDIRELNSMSIGENSRECRICGEVSKLILNNDNIYICDFCNKLVNISNELIMENRLLYVTTQKIENAINLDLPLLNGDTAYLNCAEYSRILGIQKEHNDLFISTYGINKLYTGFKYYSKLWMGNYYAKDMDRNLLTFEKLADKSQGVKKIGVLRADVDFLGKAFIQGFERTNDADRFKYVSLSRYSTLSRNLSLFFKKHINEILSAEFSLPRFCLDNEKSEIGKQGKNVTIVYSGGDDLFIIGAWNEVLETAIDLRNIFDKYTGGALTLSAGYAIFDKTYPISRMAEVTAALESKAKSIDENKNAISLFGEEITPYGTFSHTYKWDTFLNGVIGEKLRLIQTFFKSRKNKDTASGNSFLYKIMNYAIQADDKINIARCAYLLGKLAPNEGASETEKSAYSAFSKNIYKWILDKEDRGQLLTAINIYIYLNRVKEDK